MACFSCSGVAQRLTGDLAHDTHLGLATLILDARPPALAPRHAPPSSRHPHVNLVCGGIYSTRTPTETLAFVSCSRRWLEHLRHLDLSERHKILRKALNATELRVLSLADNDISSVLPNGGSVSYLLSLQELNCNNAPAPRRFSVPARRAWSHQQLPHLRSRCLGGRRLERQLIQWISLVRLRWEPATILEHLVEQAQWRYTYRVVRRRAGELDLHTLPGLGFAQAFLLVLRRRCRRRGFVRRRLPQDTGEVPRYRASLGKTLSRCDGHAHER